MTDLRLDAASPWVQVNLIGAGIWIAALDEWLSGRKQMSGVNG